MVKEFVTTPIDLRDQQRDKPNPGRLVSSLQSSCHDVILRVFLVQRTDNIMDSVEGLPLPHALKEFLLSNNLV